MATVPSTQKILTSNEAVNTTYGGSQALKELNTWYTMEDISNTVQPYKVFTALLTQSSGDNLQTIFAGPLTIGVSYLLVGTYAGDDFSNVGGPKIITDYEYDGTYFVATGTIPSSWIQGTEIQYNTGAPVATVLENTIGNVWFSYSDQGEYTISTNGLLTISKTSIAIGLTNQAFIFTEIINNDGNSIYLFTRDYQTVPNNDLLQSTPIEIRVYN